MACTQCRGEGKIIASPCKDCRGAGKLKRTKKLQIRIPPGVDTGSKLRIRGEGDQGERGGPPGDLFVFLYLEPHDFFAREGDDILCQIPIGFVQAALGAEIEVPTLDGMSTVTIPKGTENGEIFRIKGEGFPRLRGHGRGDEVVQVVLKTPKNLTKRQMEILKEFEEISEKKETEEGLWRGLFGKEKR